MLTHRVTSDNQCGVNDSTPRQVCHPWTPRQAADADGSQRWAFNVSHAWWRCCDAWWRCWCLPDDAGGQSLVAMSSDGQSFVDGLPCVVLSVSMLMTTEGVVIKGRWHLMVMANFSSQIKDWCELINFSPLHLNSFCLFTLCYKINLNHMRKVIFCVWFKGIVHQFFFIVQISYFG